MTWEPASYALALPSGQPTEVHGYAYRGLGLHLIAPPSRKGRVAGRWSLTHLNTGHRVADVTGNLPTAFAAATAVAELGDWDFNGVGGWKNMDPELPGRLGQLARDWIGVLRFGATSQDHAQASAISTARA